MNTVDKYTKKNLNRHAWLSKKYRLSNKYKATLQYCIENLEYVALNYF